jgi:glyoxalase family protein
MTDPIAAAIPGIHHITVIASDPQRNLDFYSHVLGQRLVKTTVNFDDPGTYHFYYGDAVGTPGTILTFFPWPGARPGQPGAGEANAVAYAAPIDALPYWAERLARYGIVPPAGETRFGEPVLVFQDPDGLALEIIATPGAATVDPWHTGPIPAEVALCGFHSTTLAVAQLEQSAALLVDSFGFSRAASEAGRSRFVAPGPGPGRIVDLVEAPEPQRGRLGAGSIHHIAFRVPDDAAQAAWRSRLTAAGLAVTEVRDRQYFHSIYFREPSGVLYELATDSPGFLWDESEAELGQSLKLPPWLEPRRATIEQHLPALQRSQRMQP